MRLVLQFQHTDGYTFWCTTTLPVNYDSPEALLVDFMAAAEGGLGNSGSFQFLETPFRASDFYEHLGDAPDRNLARQIEPDGALRLNGMRYLPTPPDIFTLDEWFQRAPTPQTPPSAG